MRMNTIQDLEAHLQKHYVAELSYNNLIEAVDWPDGEWRYSMLVDGVCPVTGAENTERAEMEGQECHVWERLEDLCKDAEIHFPLDVR